MSTFICPVCKAELISDGKVYRCINGHCYDISKYGYVNLLPSVGKGRRHGDDKLMVKARKELLDKGYYDPLVDTVADCAVQYAPDHAVILDAGCGEGKYTCRVLERMRECGKEADMIGIDISKDALIYAAKRSRELSLAAASSSSLPVADESTDILLNVFSPFMGAEFSRVLKKQGRLIRVYPLEKHLWELKTLIYDKPYENPVNDMDETGFRIAETKKLCWSIELQSGEDIMNLFKMTPYYYKTGAEDQKKAASAGRLTTRLEFGIAIYEKL